LRIFRGFCVVLRLVFSVNTVQVTECYYLALDPAHVQLAVNQLDYTSPPADGSAPR
jgi:hypothetical protein